MFTIESKYEYKSLASRLFVLMSVIGRLPTGEDVPCFVLSHGEGSIEVSVIPFGATITSIRTPSSDGKLGEVTLGFDEAAPYHDGRSPYFGCVAGRVANRIANGKFTLNGKEYTLATNNGPNHLHGGNLGFDKKLWDLKLRTQTSLTLELTAAEGEEGYPGTLSATVTYSLPTPTSMKIEYSASTDAATPCNLTNHAYYNLAGDGGAAPVLAHEIELCSDFFTPVDSTSIPLGEVRTVDGPMDLRSRVPIGKGLAAASDVGYDHNFCVSGPLGADGLRAVARVWEPTSGRWMTVRSDQPGVQFYTGGFLDGVIGRGSVAFHKHHGFCLETQNFPDAVNRPHFPRVILNPGERYVHVTVHEFGASASAPVGPW